MKKTTFNSGLMTGTFFRSVIALFFFSIMGLFPFVKSAIAQNVIHRDKPSMGFDEKKALEIMKKDGVPDALIDKWIAKRKLMYLNSQFQQTSNSKLNNPPVVNAACGDMGGEN